MTQPFDPKITLVDIETGDLLKIKQDSGLEVIVTSGYVCIRALMQSYRGEEMLAGDKKLERYLLAIRIRDSMLADMNMELAAEDIVLLKDLIGKAFYPGIVGQMYKFLG